MSEEASFESWALVELFGHQVIAGKVSEQRIGDQAFVRVDVPATDIETAYTKLYGAKAIYCITPTDEQTALQFVKRLRKPPVDLWRFNMSTPQLMMGDDDDGE